MYKRVYVDFLPGSHGNYLEFICNKFFNVMPDEYVNFIPFNEYGSSHHKLSEYANNRVFVSFHSIACSSKWLLDEFRDSRNGTIVHIDINKDDLLPLMQISLLRAGDMNLDNDCLEVDTYHKLNNDYYRSTLENLKRSFFEGRVKESYNAVKDPSWPEINNLHEYYSLPELILDECENIHNLTMYELSEEYPNCPREILREFFAYGFRNSEQNGFMIDQDRMKAQPQYKTHRVFNFKYSTFYNTKLFKNELERLSEFLNLPLNINDEFYQLHKTFLKKQPYKNAVSKCKNPTSKKFTLLEESYCKAFNLNFQ